MLWCLWHNTWSEFNFVVVFVKARPNQLVDRIITTSLEVVCKQKKMGCTWIGTISNYLVIIELFCYLVLRFSQKEFGFKLLIASDQ